MVTCSFCPAGAWNLSLNMSSLPLLGFSVFQQLSPWPFADSTVGDECFKGRASTQRHSARPVSQEVARQLSAYMIGLGSTGETDGQKESNRTEETTVKICLKCNLLWLKR